MTKNGSFLRRAVLLCAAFFATSCAGADDYRLQTLAEGLEHPWGVAVISDREVLVTERVGRLRRVIDGVLQTQPISGVPEVHFAGQVDAISCLAKRTPTIVRIKTTDVLCDSL